MLLCFAEARSRLGEKCAAGLSVCVAENSECRDDGSNTATDRCQCVSGYVAYEGSDGVQFCGELTVT